MLSLDGGIRMGATGRRQASRISLESGFHCFIVAHRVNTERRLQHWGEKVLQHTPYPPDPWCGVALISTSGDAYGVRHLLHCWKQTTDKPV